MTENLSESILTETAFAPAVRKRLHDLLGLLSLLRTLDPTMWLKRHYMKLVELSHDAETFLDDHGARNNKTFSYLAECIASMRGLSKAAVSLKHLESRYERYQIRFDAANRTQFARDTEFTAKFLGRAIADLIRSFEEELAARGIPNTEAPWADASISEHAPRYVLPHNIDEENVLDEEAKIAEVASRYLAAAERVALVGNRRVEGSELRTFVLRNLDEERARSLESQIHSIQSKYDTFVRMTSIETRTPALPLLRGHASLVLHLLEIGVELIHFYVRHENDVRYEPAKQRIAGLVDKGVLLDRIVNYVLHRSNQVLGIGKAFAEEILKTFVPTQELAFEIPPDVVLHARPVSMIVRIVAHYGTPVRMTIGEESCSAGSIMEMILAVGNNATCRAVKFAGDARALRDIRILFENRLGEGGVQALPSQLDYLKG